MVKNLVFKRNEVEIIAKYSEVTNSDILIQYGGGDLVIFRDKASGLLYDGWWEKENDTFTTQENWVVNENEIDEVLNEWKEISCGN